MSNKGDKPVKRFSTTIHYDSVNELKDQLIQLHGELGQPSGEVLMEPLVRPIVQAIANEIISNPPPPEPRQEADNLVNSIASETDIDGIPWDERIHSSGKTRTTTGQWTKRKRLPEGEYEKVMNELKQKVNPISSFEIPPINIVEEQSSPSLPEPQPKQEDESGLLIPVNLRDGRRGSLTPQEHLLFQQGVPYDNIVAMRQPESTLPMYDFENFHKTLPNVLTNLFNLKLLNAQNMNELGRELEVPQLWMVMQDRTKSEMLFKKLQERQIIKGLVL